RRCRCRRPRSRPALGVRVRLPRAGPRGRDQPARRARARGLRTRLRHRPARRGIVMTPDPQMQAILDQMKAAGWKPTHTLSVAEARRAFKGRVAKGAPVARTVDRTIPGYGGALPVRIHWPTGNGPFPALVFFHGGGWVLGDLDSHDVTCRSLTNQAACVTVSVDYRLAPEHKFPAAVEDAYVATRWVADHAADLGVNPARLAVGGASAGGNLATVVSLMARERGGPAVGFPPLLFPLPRAGPRPPSAPPRHPRC